MPVLDEFGRKLCITCGKPEGEVSFTDTKNECKVCRADKARGMGFTDSQLYSRWSKFSAEKSKVFLKGKIDPCDGCKAKQCDFCAVYHAKMKFLFPGDGATDKFIEDFNKNLLAFIQSK